MALAYILQKYIKLARFWRHGLGHPKKTFFGLPGKKTFFWLVGVWGLD